MREGMRTIIIKKEKKNNIRSHERCDILENTRVKCPI